MHICISAIFSPVILVPKPPLRKWIGLDLLLSIGIKAKFYLSQPKARSKRVLLLIQFSEDMEVLGEFPSLEQGDSLKLSHFHYLKKLWILYTSRKSSQLCCMAIWLFWTVDILPCFPKDKMICRLKVVHMEVFKIMFADIRINAVATEG